MRIGVTRESHPGETRVSATPATAAQLIALGYEVVVGPGGRAAVQLLRRGLRRRRRDESGTRGTRDIVFKVNAPNAEEIARLRDGATLVALLSPALNPELVDALAARPITALAMDAVPRISRAQSLDVLSSMANIAGYRAVIEAAHVFGRFFTGQVTAAGKVPPAKVLVAGAGVAGLAAIGAASSLGAIVRATDPRPEVAEQVRSLGGEFLAVESSRGEVSADGYAKATSEDYDRRAAEIYAEQAARRRHHHHHRADPRPPGAAADHRGGQVASMKPGSVIVDMAAQQGGNVAGSVAGEAIVTDNGVTIIGYTDLAGRLPAQASQLYGTNLVNLMKLLTPGKDGQLVLDLDDVVQRGITVVRNGEKMWPPPPVQVSAVPAATPAARAPAPAKKEKQPLTGGRRYDARRGRRGAAVPAHRLLAHAADRQLHRLRARGRHRLLRDRQRAPRAAHAADVGHQRDLRDHHRRRAAADRPRGHGDHGAVVRRDPAGEHQHLRRLRRDPPHARHVLEGLTRES